MKQILELILNGKSKLLGQGKWEKDSCYRVYEVKGKFYSIIVYDQMNMYLMDNTLQEIREENIVQYI
jgi:hypothetical protein